MKWKKRTLHDFNSGSKKDVRKNFTDLPSEVLLNSAINFENQTISYQDELKTT